MNFRTVLESVISALRAERIDFALIGGIALAALGVPRATGDLDLLVDGTRADDVDALMRRLGYACLHRSDHAGNYAAEDERLGRVDFLFARKPPSRAMLARAQPCAILERDDVKVADAEDVIGLKVQSSSNDPRRLTIDMADIERLVASRIGLDLDRVREYFRLFDRESELDALLARQGRS